jgi:hypothetical protein
MAKDWEIKITGDRSLTVELPEQLKLADPATELEPETLARAILQWVEEQKLGSSRGEASTYCGIQWVG